MNDYISEKREQAAMMLHIFTHSSLPACQQFVDFIIDAAKEEVKRELGSEKSEQI